MTKKIIVDSSPLIVLLKSDLEYILPKLFEEIIVPEEVWQEISVKKSNDIAAQKLPNLEWLKRTRVEFSNPIIESFGLGKGETAVLNLALTIAESKVLLDDFAARKSSKAMKISTLGTGGLIIMAKQNGLIPSVSESLSKVQDAGLWLSGEIIEMIIEKAGE